MALETELTIRAKDLASSQFKNVSTSLDQVSRTVQNASRAFLAFVGVTSVSAVVRMASETAALGEKMQRTSRFLGMSVENLDAYRQTAKESGMEIDALTKGFEAMGKNVSMASNQLGEAQKALVELNLNAKELAKLKIEDQFLIIVEALSGIANESDRTNAAMKIFGDRGAEIASVFGKGAQAVIDYTNELKTAGKVMTDETANSLAEINKQMKEIEERWTRMKSEAVVAVAPAMLDIISLSRGMVKSLAQSFNAVWDAKSGAELQASADKIKQAQSDAAWSAILSGQSVPSSMSNATVANVAAQTSGMAAAGGKFKIPDKVKIQPSVPMPSFAGMELAPLGGERQMYERASMESAAVADSFAQGWVNAIEEVQAAFNELWGTAAAKGRTMAMETSRAMASAFESIFFDAFEGHLQRLDQYVTQFLNSVAKSMMSMMSQQAANGIIMQIGGAMGGAFGGSAAATRGMPANWNSSALGAPGGGAPISRGKMRVEIINQSGVEMQGSQAYVRDDISGAVLGIVIDAAGRNKGGFRDALRGAMT